MHGYGWHVQKGLWASHSSSYIHDSHIQLVRDCLKVEGWTRLLLLEHDHDFHSEMLFKHSQYTQPIVSGIYVQRKVEEPLPVIYNWDVPRLNAVRPSRADLHTMLANPGLHEVDIVPMGCTSIRRDVLENWPQETPMFFSPVNPATEKTMSDDVWFCRKAQDQGYQAYVDTSNVCTHYSLFPIDPSFFIKWDAYQKRDAA